MRLKCCYAAYLYKAHIVFFFFRFLDISPMYTTRHFVQSVLYIPASVLLLFRLVLNISLIFLEVVLMNFRLRMVKLIFL